jgi:hypothetical protein
MLLKYLFICKKRDLQFKKFEIIMTIFKPNS